MASKIEKALIKAAGKKFSEIDGEKLSKRKIRLLKAVSANATATDDASWNELSEEAQQYFNECGKALKAKEKLPPWPDATEDKEEDKTDTEKPAKKGKTGKKGKDKSEEADKPETDKDKAKALRKGAIRKYVVLMVTHPDWEKKRVFEKINANGQAMTPMTSDNVFYYTNLAREALKEAGLLRTPKADK